jgi:hypothetical protein
MRVDSFGANQINHWVQGTIAAADTVSHSTKRGSPQPFCARQRYGWKLERLFIAGGFSPVNDFCSRRIHKSQGTAQKTRRQI